MARIRTIKPQFFTSGDVVSRSPFARLLILGLLTESDSEGRLEDKPKQLKRRLFPSDDVDVDVLLWELTEPTDEGDAVIRRYVTEEGFGIIQIINFVKHQRPHPREPKSIFPATGKPRERTRQPEINDQIANKAGTGHVPTRREPGDIPATTGGKGREGDLEYGVRSLTTENAGEREGQKPEGDAAKPEGDAARPHLRPLISGSASPRGWGLIHGSHVAGFCDWVCLPDVKFDTFVQRVAATGVDPEEAKKQVLEWAHAVRKKWTDERRIPGDDIFRFWDHEWQRVHGSNRPSSGAIDLLAGFK